MIKGAVVVLEKSLQYINVLFLLLMFWVHSLHGGNEYVNSWTIFLTTLLIIQVLFFLEYSIKKNIILLTVLSFILTFFYILRVITLNYIPFSNVFNRYLYSPDDINYCLTFIICANLFLFLGVLLSPPRKTQAVPLKRNENIKFLQIIFLLLFAILLIFASNDNNSFALRLINYLTLFFLNARYLLLACIIYMLLNKKHMNKKMFFYLYSLIVLYVLISMFAGSRQAIYSIIIFFIIALLSVYSKVYFKLKYIITGIFLLPFMVVMFFFATLLRQNNVVEKRLDDKIDLLKDKITLSSSINEESLKFILTPIFDRIGFLDYATEIITQKNRYSKVLNLKYYAKSIVDNVLTPGFNIFGTPKVANSLIYIYNNKGTPTHEAVSLDYQSDELTIYGELYCLFGKWRSLFLFIPVGYIFNRLLSRNCLVYRDYLIKGFCILIWYTWINSFGIDWLMLDILSLIFSGWVVLFLLKIKFIRKNTI